MNDKPLAEVPRESAALEGSRLLTESSITSTTLEDFKKIAADSHASQTAAVLPAVELFDHITNPSVKISSGDSQTTFADKTRDADIAKRGTDELALTENGRRVEEIPHPDGSYFGSPRKEIHYDNGTVRWEFDDGST